MDTLTKGRLIEAQALQLTLIDLLNHRVGDKATFGVSLSMMNHANTGEQGYDFHVVIFDRETNLLKGDHYFSYLTDSMCPHRPDEGKASVEAMTVELQDFLDKEFPQD